MNNTGITQQIAADKFYLLELKKLYEIQGQPVPQNIILALSQYIK